jgi:hypothetical protein
MSEDKSLKAQAWTLFDRIVEPALTENGQPSSNPWWKNASGLWFKPDYSVLQRLLGVPLLLGAPSQSGVPALALDVWTAYELRRAGFEPDLVWPRATPPRILPSTLVALRREATREQRRVLDGMLQSGKTYGGETGASANILGKNYVKQVDVVMSTWNTGPEIMISTKRMDSSFGKNAANRVEESYGDAKNLRSRHPQAALGFFFSLRSTVLTPQFEDVAVWIIDLLGKLGREDDAYDAVCLVIPDWSDDVAAPSGDDDDGEDPLVSAGLAGEGLAAEEPLPLQLPESELDRRLRSLPTVELNRKAVPENLRPEVFFATIINRVLDNSPVNFHREARRRRANPNPR